jgi:prepilin-type N-terminal cleavage/methylation domain-containing protein
VKSLKKTARIKHSGFTLVELLVVIAIIAILAAVVVLIINPIELTRRGRDAARLTDLANLQQAINVAVQESSDSAQEVLCNGVGTATCTENTVTGARSANGTGWVKVNLSAQKAVSVPTLPVDPSNGSAFHYVYCADTANGAAKWMIIAKLESDQQKGKMQTDGVNDDFYQIGSDYSITCTY